MLSEDAKQDEFPVPIITVDSAVFSVCEGELRVLLVRRAVPPYEGEWGLPGGFVDTNFDHHLEGVARRKVAEKTGASMPYLEQVETFGGRTRDPRGWSVTVLYLALIRPTEVEPGIDSVTDSRWFSWEDAKQLALAFDHGLLLEKARERLKNKTAYSALPIHAVDTPFSLTELQEVFEVLMDTRLEKKSFRRRLLNANLLEQVGERRTPGERGRPSALYRPKRDFEQFDFVRVFG